MSTEVVLVILDVNGRSGQEWVEILNDVVQDHWGEFVHVEEEEV